MVIQAKDLHTQYSIPAAPISSLTTIAGHQVRIETWADDHKSIALGFAVETKHGKQFARVYADPMGVYGVEVQSHSHPEIWHMAFTAWGSRCTCYASANKKPCYHTTQAVPQALEFAQVCMATLAKRARAKRLADARLAIYLKTGVCADMEAGA